MKMNGDGIPAVNMYCGNQTIFVCEKAVSNVSPWTHLPYRKYVDPIIKFYFVRFYFFLLYSFRNIFYLVVFIATQHTGIIVDWL